MRIVLLQPYFLHRALAAIVGEGHHIDARGEGGSGDRDLARFTVEVFAPHQSAGGVDEFGQAVAVARQGYDQSIGCAGDAQGSCASFAHGQYTVAIVQGTPVVVILYIDIFSVYPQVIEV